MRIKKNKKLNPAKQQARLIVSTLQDWTKE
jgi:hypothetical protein